MLDPHNRKRASRGLVRLRVHPALMKAAGDYSREKDFFSHHSSNGETFSARLKRFDYEYRSAGENVAWGPGSSGSPDSTLNNRTGSTGRKANVLDKNIREIGVGAAEGTRKGTRKIYGNPRRRGLPASEPALAPVYRRILTPYAAARRAPHQNRLYQKRIPRPRREPSRSGRAPRRPGTGDLAPRVPSIAALAPSPTSY
jgi:hypothetical protein